MTKELNIINGGLTPKRPPNILAEMAKAAQERQATLPESLKVEIQPEPKKPVYILHIKLYDDDLRAIPYNNDEDRLAVYIYLYDAMVMNTIIDIIIDNARCVIRGKNIQLLSFALSDNGDINA